MTKIVVYGTPAPQGSKRFVGYRGGRGVMIESSAKVKPWREAVKSAALDIGSHVAGPIRVEMTFTLQKPKSASKKKRTWPDRKPDLSKLVRATEDALTDAGLWEDDARIVACHAYKVFPGEGEHSLHIPGVVIFISGVGEDQCITKTMGSPAERRQF